MTSSSHLRHTKYSIDITPFQGHKNESSLWWGKGNLNEDCSRSVYSLEQMGPHYWRNFTPNMNIAPGCFFFPPGRRRLLRVFSHIPQAQMVWWRLGAHRQTTVPSLNPGSAFSTRADWRAFLSREHSQIPNRLTLERFWSVGVFAYMDLNFIKNVFQF